jgi:acyl-CoA thioesterase-1
LPFIDGLNYILMKKSKSFICTVVFIAMALSGYSQGYHVRIGIIGNSITEGSGLTDPETQSYPAQLAPMLHEIYGDTCIVQNFGITTTTMLKNGNVSYWNSTQFEDYMEYAAEICIILLGTNDSKPVNWDEHGDEFIGDYLSMIDTIKTRNPHTKFFAGYPPPAFEIVYDIRDSVILNGVIPAVDSVVAVTGAELIDFYYPLLDSVSLFTDKIHPNIEGSRAMAQIILDKFLETDIIHEADTGYTFVTSFDTEKSLIAFKDTVLLSWTTINADSVLLNGQVVPENGSLKVSPHETTIYTLLASGEKSTDSLVLVQEVYYPELSTLKIYPKSKTLYEGDSIYLQLYYYDQLQKRINDTVYDLEWSIVNGNGYLCEETGTSAVYVAVSEGTDTVYAEYGDISGKMTMTIKPAVTGILDPLSDWRIRIFPNPADNKINLFIAKARAPYLKVKIFDLKGILYKDEDFYFKKGTRLTVCLRTSDLAEGTYIIEIECSGRVYTDKIFIKRGN